LPPNADLKVRPEGGRACVAPKLFVQGSLDQFGTVEDLKKLFSRLKDPKELRIIEGADHFFEGRLEELGRIVSGFISGDSSPVAVP
jgi:alpha/beta superfamily hydrolase